MPGYPVDTTPPTYQPTSPISTVGDYSTAASPQKNGRMDLLALLRELTVNWPPTVGETFVIWGDTMQVAAVVNNYIYINDETSGAQYAFPYQPYIDV